MNEPTRDEMTKSTKQGEFILPLELQFSMRKAEINAQEMTWEQLYSALLNLYYQRLMEWHAVKELMCAENIKLDFDIPTDIELQKLAQECIALEEDDDDEDPFTPA
tara:strand:+ start:5307 stop:5624 length:318 start_codon:yes stop_codon:yes gene_type:complete